MDTIVRMKPVAPDGSSDVLVAVCTFSKWVEIGTVPRLDSTETARWFHTAIVCRYGLPGVVRTDGGQEYRGRFSAYLREAGVVHRRISTRNPRANG